MTVNHDVAGSSPAGGAKTKTTQSGGFCFGFFLLGLDCLDIMIRDVSRACLHDAGGCPQGKLAIWPELCDGQMNEYIFKIVFFVKKMRLFTRFDECRWVQTFFAGCTKETRDFCLFWRGAKVSEWIGSKGLFCEKWKNMHMKVSRCHLAISAEKPAWQGN